MILLARSRNGSDLRSVCGESRFGFLAYHTAALPDRVYQGLDAAARPPSIRLMEPELDLASLPTPLASLFAEENGSEGFVQATRKTAMRLEAFWLLLEDRHRLLDVGEIEPLAHQASLLEHVLRTPQLTRVMIADEVGLGKTVEAGRLVKHLVDTAPTAPPRVLYLTEAQLVDNVAIEFERLGLRPRRWTTRAQEARLGPNDADSLVIASIHRAVLQIDGGANHFETFRRSGPWDVIVVDEAHHLSDWSPTGGDPGQRMALVRALVRERLTPDGRLLLLTGTPHQGHEDRFRNLLRLLSEDGRDERQAAGRVIYRLKEDVLDWDGNPLFPLREVRQPTVVEVGPEYRRWMEGVHHLLAPQGASRAAGWRRAQALQWCASSPEAGLAYLVRLALRSGYTTRRLTALKQALTVLRPYRGGPVDEPIESLEERLGASEVAEDEEDDPRFSDQADLAEALMLGANLVRGDAIAEKLRHVLAWLDSSGEEKFVIFAQPLETVFALRRRIEQHLGPGTVAMLVGGQDAALRQNEIGKLTRDARVRVLVSSRSGGEGINLQVSRRLVHFDVPWNPMEMEQRVGRVHRYGSIDTILVDTIVLAESREQRVLDRARARLAMIARDLVGHDIDPARFELVFSRTMSLVPLEELATLMAGESFGPLTHNDEQRLDQLVREGFQQWRMSDATFREKAQHVLRLERGEAREEDLESFLVRAANVLPWPGWKRRALERAPGGNEPKPVDTEARIYKLPDGQPVYVGRDSALAFVPPAGTTATAKRIGLNSPAVAVRLREIIGGGQLADRGADAFVRGHGAALLDRAAWSDLLKASELPDAFSKGMLVLAYAVRRLDLARVTPRETAAELHVFAVAPSGEPVTRLSAKATALLVRRVRDPRPKRARPAMLDRAPLQGVDERLASELRAIQPNEPVAAVFPVVALWVEPEQ